MAQTPTPIDTALPGQYQGQQLDAESAYQQALTNIAQQQASLAHDTGFTYNQADDGSVNNVAIDPNNQYSSVMGLLSNHASDLHDLRSNLAGRGITGNGLAAKRAALLKFVQTGETSNLGANFSKSLSSLFSQKAAALNTRNTAFTSAEQAALLYALQQQQFNTAKLPGSGDYGTGYNGLPGVGSNGPATPGYGGGANVYGDPARPGGLYNGQYVQPITYQSIGATPTAITNGVVQPPKTAGIRTTATTPQQGLAKTIAKSPYAAQVAKNSY